MKIIFLEFIQIVREKFLRYRLYPGTELLFNLYTFLSFKSLKIRTYINISDQSWIMDNEKMIITWE